MPFGRQTLVELRQVAETEIASRLGTGPLLSRSRLGALARVVAGFAHHCLGFVQLSLDQVFPSTADTANLERHASLRSIARKEAAPATGSVTFSGTESTTIPSGTEVQRLDGELYTTDAAAVISGGVASVSVTASVAGAAGNEAAGQTLSLTSPIPGIVAAATVDAGGLSGGVDRESDENLRARVLQRWREPPQGGSVADYEAAALAVAGVTRAFALPNHMGAGTVGLTFFVDDDPVSIIPDAAKVADVAAALEAIRSVTADLIVFAPAAKPLNPLISLDPDDGAIRQNVSDELEDMLRRDAAPGATIRVSRIREAISHAVGEVSHVLNYPTADVTTAKGEIVVLGSILWGIGAQPDPLELVVELPDPTVVIA